MLASSNLLGSKWKTGLVEFEAVLGAFFVGFVLDEGEGFALGGGGLFEFSNFGVGGGEGSEVPPDFSIGCGDRFFGESNGGGSVAEGRIGGG